MSAGATLIKWLVNSWPRSLVCQACSELIVLQLAKDALAHDVKALRHHTKMYSNLHVFSLGLIRSAQQVEDEHHFLFDCPMYSSLRASHASVFQRAY
ncbi:hypothetical protein ABBQ38_003907 [Trebouxia sp. C0009 RCD-2024]